MILFLGELNVLGEEEMLLGSCVCVCAQISFHLFTLMRSEVKSVTL